MKLGLGPRVKLRGAGMTLGWIVWLTVWAILVSLNVRDYFRRRRYRRWKKGAK